MPDSAPAHTELEEVLEALSSSEKSIPSRYFYDGIGGALFEEITALDEYYLTRTERTIFDRDLPEMVEHLSTFSCLIEYGSGNGEKIRQLLDRLPNVETYVPVDISSGQLEASAARLATEYPHVQIRPVCADFTRDLRGRLPALVPGAACVFFPGSTIGNLQYAEAAEVLRRTAALIGSGGGLLIGIDLAKDAEIVERAYNDSKGVTARFNRNILSHLNDRLGSDFDPDQFDHRAIYNRTDDRVEMYLVSKCRQNVRLNGTVISLGEDEAIRTEYSYKYPLDSFRSVTDAAGFDTKRVWLDTQRYFSVQFLSVR